MKLNETKYPNCIVEFSDGTSQLVDARELLINGLAKWEGWHCKAGSSRIMIEADLSVYSGECLNDKLGNLKTGWELLPAHTICKRAQCTGDVSDLIIDKVISTIGVTND